MVFFVDETIKYTDKILELIREFNKLVLYKINAQTPIVFP